MCKCNESKKALQYIVKLSTKRVAVICAWFIWGWRVHLQSAAQWHRGQRWLGLCLFTLGNYFNFPHVWSTCTFKQLVLCAIFSVLFFISVTSIDMMEKGVFWFVPIWMLGKSCWPFPVFISSLIDSFTDYVRTTNVYSHCACQVALGED